MNVFGNNGGNNGGMGNGPPGVPPNWPFGASIQAQANKAGKDFNKAFRMTFVRTWANLDEIAFLYADEYQLCEEIATHLNQLVEVDDIRTQKQIIRRKYTALQFSKEELGSAAKFKRFGM